MSEYKNKEQVQHVSMLDLLKGLRNEAAIY